MAPDEAGKDNGRQHGLNRRKRRDRAHAQDLAEQPPFELPVLAPGREQARAPHDQPHDESRDPESRDVGDSRACDADA